MVKVAMCAGHGGFGVTPGKRSPDGEYEWDFNNKVVIAALAKLKANGIDVLRTDDPSGHTDVPLKTRTDKANAWGADVYVSYHHNANTGKWGTWTGTETFTYLGDQPKSEKLAKEVQSRIVKVYGLKDRGLKKANFHIVRETKMPAILCEGGYMDSTIDIKKLRDNAVLKAAGEAVADGIMAYFGMTPKAEAPASKPTPNPTPQPVTELYRVRKTWSDDGTQLGAFRDKELAIKAAKKYSGYEVYDHNGNVVWAPAASTPAPAPAQTSEQGVVAVTADVLNVRSGPSPNYKVVKQITKGQEYKYYAIKDGWYNLGGDQWVSGAYLQVKGAKVTPAPASKPAGIPVVGQIRIVGVKNAAYICDRPSANSKNLGTAKLGTRLSISGSVPGWWEVVYQGRRAYVSVKFGERV